MAEDFHTVDLSVPANYRRYVAQRYLRPLTKAQRLALRGVCSLCHQALRQAPPPPKPVSDALPDDQHPISTEARYARARGRYGRHRGEDGDDAAGSKAKRSGVTQSAALRQSVGARNNNPWNTRPRRIARPKSDNQAPRRVAFPASAGLRASEIRTPRGATSP